MDFGGRVALETGNPSCHAAPYDGGMDVDDHARSLGGPVFSVGHSNHTLDHLLSLLKEHEIEVLIDVRSAPYSRYSPQFNRENVAGFLDEHSIRYEFLGRQLGGRPDDPECYDEAGHVIYDRLEDTREFQEGIDELQWLLTERRTLCVMCSEEDPAVCHRAMSVGHVLNGLGIRVLHVRKDGTVQEQSELRGKMINAPQQTSLFEEAPLRKSLQPVLREKVPNSSSMS